MAKVTHVRPSERSYLPLVRAGSAVPFIGFLQAVGAPVERYLAAAGLSSLTDEAPESLVPLRPVLEFFDRAATAEGIESFGLLVGARTELDALGAFGRVILRSVTVEDAIRAAAENMRLYNSAERIWLHREDDRVLICHSLYESAGDRHGHLFAIMLLIKIIRRAAGPGWWPREIRLPESETKWLKTYAAIVPTDWAPHAEPFSAIVIDWWLLAQRTSRGMNGRRPHPVVSRASVRTDHGTRGECGLDDARFLRSSAPADDLSRSVQQAIGGLLRAGHPGIRVAAELAGLSVRTLSRRLAEEGTSYERLVEQTRFSAAVDLLRNNQLRLIDIAYELGYTDPANFTRAFRRWAGMPPSEYRRLCERGDIDMPVLS
jgi:AraC-like DNA-binding protein